MKRQTGTNEQLDTTASGGGGGGTVDQGNAGLSSWKVVEDNSAAILAAVSNIPVSPSTSAKQDTGNTALASIATSVANIPADPAREGGNLAAILATAGATNGAAVISDADGTIQQYLRGIVKLFTALGSAFAFIRNGREGPSANFWTAIHVPPSNTKATATKASAGAGKRNICTGFTVTIATDATAPTAANLTVSLIDGSSGGTNYLWRSTISIPAVAGAQVSIVRGSLWIPGSQATAMTLEFSAAGGADTLESVSMEGTIITE